MNKALGLFIVANEKQTHFLSHSLLEPNKLVWINNKEKALRLTAKEVYHLDILNKTKSAILEA